MSEESSPEKKPGKPKRSAGSRRGKNLATGLAFGIGSAAIVAALLFANRSKQDGPD